MVKYVAEEKKTSVLKILLITLGAITAIVAAGCIVYNIFKKYFTITFECDDCDDCDCDCFEEDEFTADPLCFCEDDEIDAPEETV